MAEAFVLCGAMLCCAMLSGPSGGPPKPVPTPNPWRVQVPGSDHGKQQPSRQLPQQEQLQEPYQVDLFELYQVCVVRGWRHCRVNCVAACVLLCCMLRRVKHFDWQPQFASPTDGSTKTRTI